MDLLFFPIYITEVNEVALAVTEEEVDRNNNSWIEDITVSVY